MASGGGTIHTSRRPIRKRGCIGRARGGRRNWRIWGTCCWTIGMGSSPTSVRPTRRGRPNARRRRCCWRPAHLRAGTVGADKGYDVARFVGDVRVLEVTPHVAAEGPLECDRQPDDAAYGLSRQSAETETRGTGLWVDGRLSAGCASCVIEASRSSIGSSPSPPPRITWCGCGIWRRRVPDRRPRTSPVPRRGHPTPVLRLRRSINILMTLTEPVVHPSSSAAC